MIRRTTKLLLAIALCLALAVPASAGFFNRGTEGNGELTTVTYDLDDCDRILLECGLDITVRFGDHQTVALTVDENLVELYEIESRNGRLVIDADKNPRPHKKTRLEVTLKQLDQLKISGAGDIEIIDYDGADLELIIDGAGDIEVDGRVDNLDITLNGAGDIDARKLTARDVEVTVNGAGDVTVFASGSADLSINGVGDIDIYGKPEHFAKSVSGVGDIDRK